MEEDEITETHLRTEQVLETLPYLVIALAGSLAWFPLLGPYIPVADDIYHSAFWGSHAALAHWFQTQGVWRIVGTPITVAAITYHSLLYHALAVCTHLLAACFFFRVCWLLLGSVTVSLVLALIVVAFPWGYGAVVLAGAYPFVLATAMFWANLLILFRYSNCVGQQMTAFLISYGLTVSALLIQESLTFSFMASGAILWVTSGEFSLSRLKKQMASRFAGWGPMLAGLTYIGLYQLFRTSVMTKKIPPFNARSILSTYYYQWSNIDVFQPWLSQICRKLIVLSWDWKMIVAAAFLCAALIIALLVFFQMSNDCRERETPQRNKQLLLYIVLLLLGASFVYAVGGGFSLDSRKKYPLIPLGLLLIGWFWCNWPALRISIKSLPVLLALLGIGISTTWLVVAIWRYELGREKQLVEFLVANNIAGAIRVKWNPDIYTAWPSMSRTWGFRMDEDWVLNLALEHDGGQPVKVTNHPSSVTVSYDTNHARWRVVPRE